MRISKVTASQLDDAAALLVRAFFDGPFWTWIAPDAAQRRAVLPWFMRMRVRDGLLSSETYVAGDPIAGVALWEPPGLRDADLDDGLEGGAMAGWGELPQRLGDAAMARLNAVIETQHPVRDRISGGAPVWYLSLLAVDPPVQRSGVGAALLRDLFARADADGVPCMLDTENEANVAYYERHGFVVAESGTLPLAGPGFWMMLRSPRAR